MNGINFNQLGELAKANPKYAKNTTLAKFSFDLLDDFAYTNISAIIKGTITNKF